MYIYIDHSISFRIRVEEKRIWWIYVDFFLATTVWAIFEVTLGITAVLSAPSNTWARMGASAETPNASLNKGWTRIHGPLLGIVSGIYMGKNGIYGIYSRNYWFTNDNFPYISPLSLRIVASISSNHIKPPYPHWYPILVCMNATILCTQLHGRSNLLDTLAVMIGVCGDSTSWIMIGGAPIHFHWVSNHKPSIFG